MSTTHLIALPLLAAMLAASAAPRAVTISRESALLDFDYSWSREAAEELALDRRFRAEAETERKNALETARSDRSTRTEVDTFHAHDFGRAWSTSGRSRLLLSLVGVTSAYTGGAHPNHGSHALLWDRLRGREINLFDLTATKTSWVAAIRRPFCILLDRERAKRRDEPVRRDEMFGECPPLKDLTLAPADHDRNGRFDHIDITADPYVAGPYVESDYEISLPVTAGMLARVKPAFRREFEAQLPVQ
jgi:hypothetical protein